MNHPRFGARDRLTRAASQLQSLASGLSASGSRLEDAWWEARLIEHIDKLLDKGGEEEIIAALQRLVDGGDNIAHDELAALVESRAESGAIQLAGSRADLLLFAAPVLAWSRYSIPSGRLPESTRNSLQTALAETLLARDARVVLADYFFSPDQLTRSFCETRRLTRSLGAALESGRLYQTDAASLPETNRFLSDVRYLVGVLALPENDAPQPIFRWNEFDNARDDVLSQWEKTAQPLLEPRMVGCSFIVLPPNAYHSACRDADRAARPYSIMATVDYLHTSLNLPADQLQVTLAPCYDKRLEEYRVSFSTTGSEEVYYGLVWPFLGADDDNIDTLHEIETELRHLGVTDIESMNSRFPLEFCEDCGAPLFPNRENEMVHAEMPDEANEGEAATLH